MKITKNQWRLVILSIIASGTDDLNVMFLAFSLSSIMADLSLNGAQAGLIATITNLGMLLGGLFFGVLGDRHNKLKVFKITLIIFSLATAGIFFVQNIYTLYLFRFIAGIGVGGEYGLALAIMSRFVPVDRMGRIAAWNGIAGQVGSIVSALIAGVFLTSLGWRGLFLFGLFPLVIVSMLHFLITDEKELNPSEKLLNGHSKPKISDLFKTKRLAHQTIMLMIMTTVQIAGYFGMMNWLPTIMQAQSGLSVKNSSLWMIATILGMSLGMLTFGRLLDTFGPRISFSVFLIISAISVYLFSWVHSDNALLIAGATMGFFVNGMFPGYGAIVARLYDQSIQTIANNVILNVGRAVGGFSSLIIGWLMDGYSVQAVMIFLSALYIMSFIALQTIPNMNQDAYMKLKVSYEH
ncbi:MFS transporter [Atopobacter phocae]|uniref:MFS transporter n=1 Tax=Atopobacter phocae TaxID=136492 RepID=UPI0004B9EBA0|nr:MFS transporter [Atopobacter phocae]